MWAGNDSFYFILRSVKVINILVIGLHIFLTLQTNKTNKTKRVK